MMCSNASPEPLIIEPKHQHLQTIILLHGRGSNGHEFAKELFESQNSTGKTLLELLPHHKWVFPSSQSLYSETFHEDINQWYDIATLTDPEVKVESQLFGMRGSVSSIVDIVDRERAICPTGGLILGGISQGFSVVLLMALMDSSNFNALIGFSSWLPFSTVIGWSTFNRDVSRRRSCVAAGVAQLLDVDTRTGDHLPILPVFLSHCDDDSVVDINLGKKMAEFLAELGHQITMIQTGKGGHWINEPYGVDQLIVFMKRHGLA